MLKKKHKQEMKDAANKFIYRFIYLKFIYLKLIYLSKIYLFHEIILKNKHKALIFFLITIFSLANSQFEEIKLINGVFSKNFNDISKALQFKVSKIEDYNFLEIKVEGTDNNNIISYYQEDKELKSRKQLSQSITNTAVMWLTKQQIQKDFYLNVEFAKNPCNLTINLNATDIPKLVVDEQYTY